MADQVKPSSDSLPQQMDELHLTTAASGPTAEPSTSSQPEGSSPSTSKNGNASGSRGAKRDGAKGGARRQESSTMQLSKALSYILRHGTVKEGLPVRKDGYVPLNAVLARPKVAKLVMENGKTPTVDDVRSIVDSNDKKRFEMREETEGVWLIRAVQGHSIAQVTELDHVVLTLDNLHLLAGEETGSRATDGTTTHSVPDGVEILHGTTMDAWEKIRASGGLDRMRRNHIHLAKGRPGANNVISGMRASSAVILHIDLIAALQAGDIPFHLASNGAVLTPGQGDTGKLPLRYITKAEEGKTGKILWQQSARKMDGVF